KDKLEENYVSVKDFGAVGDGVTDDTQAIQNTINYIKNNNNKISMHFPTGIYLVSDTLLFDFSNINIIGEDKYKTIIKDHNNLPDGKRIFEFIGIEGNKINNINIKNITVENKNSQTSYIPKSDGFRFEYIENIKIKNILVQEIAGTYGISFKHCENISIEKLKTYKCSYAHLMFLQDNENIYVNNSVFDTVTDINENNTYLLATGAEDSYPINYGVKNIKVNNSAFLNNPNWEGLETHGSENLWFTNNYIENCKTGIMCSAGTGEQLEHGNYNIINNKIIDTGENLDYGGITIQGGNRLNNVNIINNSIKGFGSLNETTIGAITIAKTKNIKIKDNFIESCYRTGICLSQEVYNAFIQNNIINNIISNGSITYGIRLRTLSLSAEITDNYFDYEKGYEIDNLIMGLNEANIVVKNNKGRFNNSIYSTIRSVYDGIPPVGIFKYGDKIKNPDTLENTHIMIKGFGEYYSDNSISITVSGNQGENQLNVISGDPRQFLPLSAVEIINAGSTGNLITIIKEVNNDENYIIIEDDLENDITEENINWLSPNFTTL
ncbi:MAG: glycosyl hydrolase family 28-related protein, partial [Bacillota bacterium]